MPWSASKRGGRDQQSRLRGLAGEKGYEVEHALRSDGWYILDSAGRKVEGSKGITFTIEEAMAWLKRETPG